MADDRTVHQKNVNAYTNVLSSSRDMSMQLEYATRRRDKVV
jgi:hypothetical protein